MALESSGKDVEPQVNIYEYPKEYFDMQVRFASKFSEITGEPFGDCLLKYTALYRRLTNTKLKANEPSENWTRLVSKLNPQDPEHTTDAIYQEYQKQPHSIYSPPEQKSDGKHFGAHGYDYYPDKKLIKVHFDNITRGERSALAKEYQADRIVDLTMMFSSIKNTHPEATTVMGGSWLYNLQSYRRLFPESFTANMRVLTPPEMSFQGNSLWGQFLNSSGGAKEENCSRFLDNISIAKSETDLIDAFPYKVLQPKADINDFYEKYGITNAS